MKKKYLSYLIIGFISGLLMIYLYNSNYFFGDDLQFHVANIRAMIESSRIHHNFFGSKILPLIGNNLGYATHLFYPNLPHYTIYVIYQIISLFHFDVYAAIKIVNYLTFFFAGITMYQFCYAVMKKELSALLGSIIYITSSYFFVDIYMRSALNESFIFIFIPLIFLAIYYLFKEKNQSKFFLYFVIGYVGMINSHLVFTVDFTVLILLVLLFFPKLLFRKENFLAFFKATLIVLGISACTLFPLIEHKLFGDYAIFGTSYPFGESIWTIDLHYIFKKSLMLDMAIPYTDKHTLLFFNIHITTIILCIIAMIKIILSIKKEKKINFEHKFIISLFVFTGISTILCVCDSIWKIIPSIFKNIQFAWRLVALVVFGSSFLAAFGFRQIKSKIKFPVLIIVLLFLGFEVYQNLNYVYYFDNLEKIECTNICGMGWQKEYLTTNNHENMTYFDNRNSQEIITDPEIKIDILSNQMPNMRFEVSKIEKLAKIEFPRVYYLGYQLQDKHKNNIKLYENKNGFLEAEIKENGIYTLKYTGTIFDKLGKYISLFTMIGILISFLRKKGVKHEKIIDLTK